MAFEFVKRIFQRLPEPDPEDPGFYTYKLVCTPRLRQQQSGTVAVR